MINAVDIFKGILGMGLQVTMTQVKEALESIDTTVIYNKHRATYRVAVWDKVSPVNGIPAEQVLERADLQGDGEVYMLYKDDKLIVLQPHVPGEAGHKKMDKGMADLHGRKHCDDLATQHADQEIFDLVLEKVAQ